MSSIAIIHFSPLELYPPVQNLLRVLAKQQPGCKIYVYTTAASFFTLTPFECGNEYIKIIRLGKSGDQSSAINRMWNYGLFYMGCIGYLIAKGTRRILYYETLSSFPAWLYKRFFNRKAEVFIHYHEYTNAAEYEGGMKLTSFFHGLEKRLYPVAKWVSHTNLDRMQLFEKDLLPVKINQAQIVPNYPPASWLAGAKQEHQLPLKIVYAGALSLDTMFTREFAAWVIRQNGKVIWHIYSYNITAEAKRYLNDLNVGSIRINAGVDYDELPAILKQYDVGVILYNGHIANYIYNAPNKLFEYLACGLDVWLPDIMTSALEYQTKQSFPKVIATDFSKLDGFVVEAAIDRTGLREVIPAYSCEKAFASLVSVLTPDD